MIVHIYFQKTGRRKPLCLPRSIGGADKALIQDPESRSCTAVLLLHHKEAETCPVGRGTIMVTDVLNQAFLSASMSVSHGALAGAGHGPAVSLAEANTSSPWTLLLMVCTPVALGGIRALQSHGLWNINAHQSHITHRHLGYFISTHTVPPLFNGLYVYSHTCIHREKFCCLFLAKGVNKCVRINQDPTH